MKARNIHEQLYSGLMEPSSSEWSSLVLLIPKHHGSVRFRVYYRRIDAATFAGTYLNPRNVIFTQYTSIFQVFYDTRRQLYIL